LKRGKLINTFSSTFLGVAFVASPVVSLAVGDDDAVLLPLPVPPPLFPELHAASAAVIVSASSR